MTIIAKAEALAHQWHSNATYGVASLFYTEEHLRKVADLLSEKGFQEEVVAAGWLHDILEDTACSESEIEEACGSLVLALVKAVTDEPGANRKERKSATYPKIRAAGRLAVAVKLADRICNLRASTYGDRWYRMYRKEQPAFQKALYSATDDIDSLWVVLHSILELE